MNTKSSFIAIIGETNAGKSTLLNEIIGAKVSIISHKVQTTRRKILGIFTQDETQLVFVDTPGLFSPKKRLEKAMVKAAWDATKDCDQIVLLVDAAKKDLSHSQNAAEKISSLEKKKILVLNKIDLLPKPKLLEIIQKFENYNFDHIFMISALKDDGVDELLKKLFHDAPPSPWFYLEDQVSDLSLSTHAEEITREKVYQFLNQELPYSIFVSNEKFENFDNGDIKITQTIIVERANQKLIVLGEKGSKIKMIGQSARKEMERFFNKKVHLFLHVTVDEKWQEKKSFYESQGLDFNH